MKRCMIILMLIVIVGSICGCGAGKTGSAQAAPESSTSEQTELSAPDITGTDSSKDGGMENMEVYTANRAIIAQALEIDENSRNIRFILNCLDTIGAGTIRSAKAIELDNEKAIDLVAEDGTNFRIILSGSGNVDAVMNLDTGEWPIKSTR